MLCKPFYPVGIKRQSGNGVGSQCTATQSVLADRQCPSSEIADTGRSASAALYSLSDHSEPAGRAKRVETLYLWNHVTEKTRTLSIAAILILGAKCAALIGDAAPVFYLGDSEDYVRVALLSPLTDGVRSFLYGTLVRCLAGWTGSLGVLLIAQVVASIATALLLVYLLLVLLHVRRAIAIAAGLAFAFDPLQLLLERTVLPETFTLLVFAWFSVVSLKYVLDPRSARLLWACVLGILLVALRVVYVPVAISAFAGLPALAWLRGRTVGG